MLKRDYRQYVSKTKSSSKKPRAHQNEWFLDFNASAAWPVHLTGGRYLLWLQLLYCTSWTHAVSCRQLWIGEKRQRIRCRFLLAHAPPSVSLLIFSDHTFICMEDAFTHESPFSTAVFCTGEGCLRVFVCSLFHLLFHNPLIFPGAWRNISEREVTLNVLGRTMWWKQNEMRRGRL